MLQRHFPVSGFMQKHRPAACCSQHQLRHGYGRHAGRACRRRLGIASALDGWTPQAVVGSSDGAATAKQQQQQLQTPLQQPSTTPGSGNQQQLQQPDPNNTVSDDAVSSSSSSNKHSQDYMSGQQQQQQQQQSAPAAPSWEAWCAHFEQQDLQGTRLDALAAPLAAAIAAEDYAAAAAIKSEADALTAADAVAVVQRELAAALLQERYADAAVLRDGGWALLEGWWACASPQHPLGHLLRVYAEYGRWTGKLYRAADVWDLQGWPEGQWGRLLGRSLRSSSSSRVQGRAGSRSRSSRGTPAAIEPEAMEQVGTPLLEVFVKCDQQQQQQQQQPWSSQAVLLQPASSAAADAAAAFDIGLEAEVGELFRAEVSRAVWGRSAVGGDAAAAAAASLSNGRKSSSSSSSSRSNTGKERLQPLLRSAGAAAAARDSSPLSPRAAAAAGASYEALVADVAAAAAAASGDEAGVGAAAAEAAAAAAPDLEPWEEVLNAAKPLLAAAAAAADAAGGVACADGALRPTHRHSSSAAAQLPTLQLLVEVVDGNSSVLLAARAVGQPAAHSSELLAGRTTHGTAWVVGDMPPGPAFVADWSSVPAADAEACAARLAASLEAQRIVRDMLGAAEGWWLTEFMGSWSPPPAAAAAARQQQQQQSNMSEMPDVDWQLPLQLQQQQQQQQDLQRWQQQLTPDQLRQQQQLGDMTLLEETAEEEGDSWPVLGDAASREGFYAAFYKDYGPGVQGPAGLLQPGASAAAAGFEQQAAAAGGGGLGLSVGLPADMAPAELDEALQTLAELKALSGPASRQAATEDDDDEPPITWRPPTRSQQQQQDPTQPQQQQAGRGSRRHSGAHADSSSSSRDSSGGSWTPAPWLSLGPSAASAAAGEGEDLERHPARITLLGRDTFTIQPTRPRRGASSGGSSSSSSSDASPRRSVFVIEVPTCLVRQQEHEQQQQQQQQQPQPAFMSATARGAQETKSAAAPSTLEEGAEDAAAALGSMAGRRSSSCSYSLAVAEDAPLLALQLPAEMVHTTLAAVAGSSSTDGAAARQRQASGAVAAAAAAAAGLNSEEGLTYRRIHTKQQPSDELQGLFLGTFGPHGPEVLALSRGISSDSGEEELTAVKLTGDANVPAGEVSFRVRIGRRHRRDGKGVYPPQLDVKARYPGEGRIASPGFTNKRWVEGELLVFSGSSSGSSSVTNGAALGFVWNVPGDKRFLILLNRINLDC